MLGKIMTNVGGNTLSGSKKLKSGSNAIFGLSIILFGQIANLLVFFYRPASDSNLEEFFDYLSKYENKKYVVDFNVNIGAFNIQKYNTKGHYNRIHCERDGIASSHKLLAWMTYLNDVEDGGETVFVNQNIEVKPEIGKTLIWPADWTHAHTGEIVNSGSKYIITGWMHLDL